jgi:hypothetical protein
MQLQVLQTLAAHKDPSKYPMRPRQIRVQNSTKLYNNVSLAIDKWLKAMPAQKRAQLLTNFNLEAHLTPEMRIAMQRVKIELTSAHSVLEQVDLKSHFNFVDAALITRAETMLKAGTATVRAGGGQAAASRVGVNTGVKFRLHKVECYDETTRQEWKGKDDIKVAGVAIDDKNNVTEIPEFLAGEFNDGDKVVYNPPKLLKTFTLSGAYPKLFVIFIAIAESDSGGGFATFIDDLIGAVKDEIIAVVDTLAVTAGTAIGGVLGGPVGALLGAAGGALVAGLVELIDHIAADEVFAEQMTSFYMESATDTFAGGGLESSPRIWTFEDYNGKYKVHYSWAITR